MFADQKLPDQQVREHCFEDTGFLQLLQLFYAVLQEDLEF